MTGVVVDASVALAWCFPDEASDYADRVLTALEGEPILVPAVWPLELASGILVGERSKRIRSPEVQRFTNLLEGLSVTYDSQPIEANCGNVLPLAREHGLSAYGAAYLELSIRRGAPLATLDRKLHRAARTAGVRIFAGGSKAHS